ncbi:MAG: vitamin B12 dependent-methionine synthase activation domain-containing protein [candidate division Zixibacteria bacterium]
MREIINIPVDKITPEISLILQGQGIPDESEVKSEITDLAKIARDIFIRWTRSKLLISDITHEDFEKIYYSTDFNESPAPIEDIYPRADELSIFALTIGQDICDEISGLFAKNDFALGSMLDTAASAGTDLASDFAASWYQNNVIGNTNAKQRRTLCYSPGYCGWHVSAQRALFAFLKPEEIGITLRESCLMEPLKSISGVLIYGSDKIHLFENQYSFCAQCPSQPCLERMSNIEN